MILRPVFLLLTVAVMTSITFAQTPIRTYRGAVDSTFAGESLATIDDLDGDGVQDYLIGESGFNGAAGARTGRVTAMSGATGAVILRVEGANAGDSLGSSMAALGDITGDGVPDFVTGSPYAGPNGANSGIVVVVDGSTGAIIRTHLGAADASGDGFGDYLGYIIRPANDVDGDGIDDYILGAPGDYFTGGGTPCVQIDQPGRVDVHSGLTGNIIHAIQGAPACLNAGISAAGLRDLNGDGFAEFAMGYYGSTATTGSFEVRDGLTGNVLRTHDGPAGRGFYGMWINEIGDIDNDGVMDYAGGGDNYDPVTALFGAGFMLAYSGATGNFLMRYDGFAPDDSFGRGFGPAGDYDSDGTDDFFVAAPFEGTAGAFAGRVSIISGATGASLFDVFGEEAGGFIGFNSRCDVIEDLDGDGLIEVLSGTWANSRYGTNRGVVTIDGSLQRNHWLSTNLVSIANASQTEFEVQGPPNSGYIVLASLSGTSPATVIGPYSIPLVTDAWFSLTFDPATHPFVNGVSFLDAQGRGTATLNIPAGLPAAFATVIQDTVAVTVSPAGAVAISAPERLRLDN